MCRGLSFLSFSSLPLPCLYLSFIFSLPDKTKSQQCVLCLWGEGGVGLVGCVDRGQGQFRKSRLPTMKHLQVSSPCRLHLVCLSVSLETSTALLSTDNQAIPEFKSSFSPHTSLWRVPSNSQTAGKAVSFSWLVRTQHSKHAEHLFNIFWGLLLNDKSCSWWEC